MKKKKIGAVITAVEDKMNMKCFLETVQHLQSAKTIMELPIEGKIREDAYATCAAFLTLVKMMDLDEFLRNALYDFSLSSQQLDNKQHSATR